METLRSQKMEHRTDILQATFGQTSVSGMGLAVREVSLNVLILILGMGIAASPTLLKMEKSDGGDSMHNGLPFFFDTVHYPKPLS